MRKMKKIIALILFLVIIIATLNTVVVNASTGNVSNFSGNLNVNDSVTASKNALVKIVATVLNLVRIVGIAIAFIILVVIACKYIIASAGDKADIKKYAFNYIVGALILFASASIVTIIRNFILSSFEESTPFSGEEMPA